MVPSLPIKTKCNPQINSDEGEAKNVDTTVMICLIPRRYQIMMNCWQNQAEARPSFAALTKQLRDMENQHKVTTTTTTTTLK